MPDELAIRLLLAVVRPLAVSCIAMLGWLLAVRAVGGLRGIHDDLDLCRRLTAILLASHLVTAALWAGYVHLLVCQRGGWGSLRALLAVMQDVGVGHALDALYVAMLALSVGASKKWIWKDWQGLGCSAPPSPAGIVARDVALVTGAGWLVAGGATLVWGPIADGNVLGAAGGRAASAAGVLPELGTGALVAVVEELLFRGVFLDAARRYLGGAWGIVAQAALFGGLHFQSPAMVAVQVCRGALLGGLAVRRQSIWPGAAVHAIWDVTAILVGGR